MMNDHRARGLLHDPLDQLQGVRGVLAETQRDVRTLASRDLADLGDLYLAGNDLVAESSDERAIRESRSRR